MSREHSEPDWARDSPPARRALVFALLDLAAEINTLGQVAADRIGINQTDLTCLNALFRDGPMGAGQVAATVGLTSGATTTAIDRLERAGYVERRNDPNDRRRVVVAASEDGARQAFSLFDGLLESVADMAGTYTEEDLARFLTLITDFRCLLAAYSATLRANP